MNIRLFGWYCPSSPTARGRGWLKSPNLIFLAACSLSATIRSFSCIFILIFIYSFTQPLLKHSLESALPHHLSAERLSAYLSLCSQTSELHVLLISLRSKYFPSFVLLCIIRSSTDNASIKTFPERTDTSILFSFESVWNHFEHIQINAGASENCLIIVEYLINLDFGTRSLFISYFLKF